MSRFAIALIVACSTSAVAVAETGMGHDDPLFLYVQAERFEFRESAGETLWDLQGWYGGDLHKLWFKSEGHADGSDVEDAELQVLYSRAWTAFFDLQFGLRVSDRDDRNVVSAVAGIQGMAPYRVEIDAALFVTEDGDVSIRSEFERDLFLSERVILQPRVELGIALQDSPELGVGNGISGLSAGLRLRYEVTRKFAPYIGVAHERSFGGTADIVRAAGGDADETTVVAGIRFWF